MVPARSMFAETSGTLIAAILKTAQTEDGQSSVPSLAGRTALVVRKSFLASKHLVNLTMNSTQQSWLRPCIRLLLDHRHCPSCLPEVEGGKSLLCAGENPKPTPASTRVARRSSARSPLLDGPCARNGPPQRPPPLPTSTNRRQRSIRTLRKSLRLSPNRSQRLVVSRRTEQTKGGRIVRSNI